MSDAVLVWGILAAGGALVGLVFGYALGRWDR